MRLWHQVLKTNMSSMSAWRHTVTKSGDHNAGSASQ